MILNHLLRPTFRAVLVEEERGSALLIVLIISILLAVLVLSMSSTIMTDFSIGNDMEKKKRALERPSSTSYFDRLVLEKSKSEIIKP